MWHRVEVDRIRELYPLELCACGQQVRRGLTVGGKRYPLDPDPVPDAAAVVRSDAPGSGTVRVHILAGDDPRDPDEVTWRPHERTCRNSPTARRLRALRTPRCHGCTEPLDPVIALAAGDTWPARWHAGCAPTITPRPTPAAGDEDTQQELTIP